MRLFIFINFIINITLSGNLLAMKRNTGEDLPNPAKRMKGDSADSSWNTAYNDLFLHKGIESLISGEEDAATVSETENIVIHFMVTINEEKMEFASTDKKYRLIWAAPEKDPPQERRYYPRFNNPEIVMEITEQELQFRMAEIFMQSLSLDRVSIRPYECTIKHLILDEIIGQKLFQFFCAALAQNKTVEILYISHLNNEKIKFLSRAFKSNESIISLTISNSNISNEYCANCLGDAIESHKMLKSIRIGYCKIGDVFVSCLIPYFKNSNILNIDLEDAGAISINTAKSLCDLLKHNRLMIGLDFSLAEEAWGEDEFIIVKECAEILKKNLRLERFALTDGMNGALQDRLKVNKKLNKSWIKYSFHFMARHEIGKHNSDLPRELNDFLCLFIFLSDLAQRGIFDLSESLQYEATMDYPGY